jgi:drug/metabolite transporter (DMT)-like permease
MIYLMASIVSSTSIFVIFRLAKNYACRLGTLITINYLTASILGFAFLMQLNPEPFLSQNHWIPFGIILGVLFIVMFFLIGISSQKAGLAATTMANKMSLVFPVFFSLYWFNEEISFLKYIALVTAILAVLLTLYKKDIRSTSYTRFYLPVIIFIGSGVVDSFIKLIQATQITELQTASFSTSVFLSAFICGILISAIKGRKNLLNIPLPTWMLGILLGLANFGSLYFIIFALNKSPLDSSLVFALNNMMIVALSATTGFFIFKENINRINLAGIVLAFLSFFILL